MLSRIALALIFGIVSTAPARAFVDLGGFESTQRFALQYLANKQAEKAALEKAEREARLIQAPAPQYMPRDGRRDRR